MTVCFEIKSICSWVYQIAILPENAPWLFAIMQCNVYGYRDERNTQPIYLNFYFHGDFWSHEYGRTLRWAPAAAELTNTHREQRWSRSSHGGWAWELTKLKRRAEDPGVKGLCIGPASTWSPCRAPPGRALKKRGNKDLSRMQTQQLMFFFLIKFAFN